MTMRVIWGTVRVRMGVTVAFHVTSHLIQFKCCIIACLVVELGMAIHGFLLGTWLHSLILANTLRAFFMCTNINLGSRTCSLDWWWCMGVAVAF